MSNTKHYRAYANATQTVAKTRQVIMLYEAAIRNLHQANGAMQEKRIEDRYKLLCKACDIIYGLQSCLDFEKGGDIARVLYDFYSSIDARIMSLHVSQSSALCEQIMKELKAMRDVWEEIDRSNAGEAGDAQDGAAAGAAPFGASSGDNGGIILSA